MSYKTKYARGICCFFGCKEQAVIRHTTSEQTFCQYHWDENSKIVEGAIHEQRRQALAEMANLSQQTGEY